MPPPKSGKVLSPAQIETIRRWIAKGAKWQPHWAFIPPVRPPIPRVERMGWIRNPIDAFVLARLEREGLSPAPEAERGDPAPSRDARPDRPAPDARARWMRSLATPHRTPMRRSSIACLARPASASGWPSAGSTPRATPTPTAIRPTAPRIMWRWRDWVIDAFNQNMPFDQFTIEQLAGDLLPGATLDQRIATGFNRNHRGNGEGGIIPEEYAVEYVVDRVDTTATVWLGLTLGCARCHDHKFDPITQQEFYQFFAFFNNVPENGRAIKYGNSPPLIKTPTRAQQQELDRAAAPNRRPRAQTGSTASRRSRSAQIRLGVVDRKRARRARLVPREAPDLSRSGGSTAVGAAAAAAHDRVDAGDVARLRLLRPVHARGLGQARRPARRDDPLADDRRAAGRGLQRRPRPGQGAGQPRQALARRRHPRRDESNRRRRSWTTSP